MDVEIRTSPVVRGRVPDANDPGLLTPAQTSLLTDQYELAMASSYLRRRMNETVVFELFVRHLPPRRRWLLAAGLGPALALVKAMQFREQELAYAHSLGFGGEFLEYLARFRFAGDIDAIPEGTIVFAGEPLVRVTGGRVEAQLLETLLLNQINFQTMVATKAARIALAAGGGEPAGERLVDFSPRRDHGTDAAMKRRGRRRSLVPPAPRIWPRPCARAQAGRHDGPLVRDVVRARGGRVLRLDGGLSRQRGDAGRHVRHRRRCAPRDRRRSGHTRAAGRRAAGLRRSAGSLAQGAGAAR
jgi:hypothetical protein